MRLAMDKPTIRSRDCSCKGRRVQQAHEYRVLWSVTANDKCKPWLYLGHTRHVENFVMRSFRPITADRIEGQLPTLKAFNTLLKPQTGAKGEGDKRSTT